ncbi:MAG TPA: hypothetical protein VF791_10375 [Pyrinomonadaceae bacterium]
MKRCPACQRTYDDSQGFCPHEGTPLVSDPPQAYDPAQTLVAGSPPPPPPVMPPAGDVPPSQFAGTEPPPNYQPYQPQPPQPPPQQQWSPMPQQQQQWGAPPPARNMNKIILLAALGLVVAAGVGLLIYFLTRSSDSTATASSNSGQSTNANTPARPANRFVGTWVEETRPNSKPSKFTEDGKITEQGPGGNDVQQGTYTATGDKASITITSGARPVTFNATLESNNRMRIEAMGRTLYLVRK